MTNRQVKIDKKKLYALVVKQKDKTAVVPTVIPENNTLISILCQFETMRVRTIGISQLVREFYKVIKALFVFKNRSI